MRAFAIFVFCLLAMGAAARAQTATSLDLSATGTALAAPDQMVASFNVQANAENAAAAQAEVNQAMAKALAAANKVAGVTATTGGYNVYQTSPQDSGQKPGYQASQTMSLTIAAPNGQPPDAFTALLGMLQQDGLLLNTLDGQLSAKAADAANAAATTDAIHRLQAQAAAIAATLGDKIGGIKQLSINGNTPGPLMAAPRAMMAMASPPPQAAPGPVTVQITVNATIDLQPQTP